MTPISHFDLLAHYWANFSPVFSSKMLRTGLIFLPSPDPAGLSGGQYVAHHAGQYTVIVIR